MKPFDAKESKGRRDSYDEDLLVHDMDPFEADYLKILQSKAYRRLAFKTQVICLPDNPHIRTRNVHTNEVISVATVISNKLGLNTNLCQAIAAGHDIGHTPYGHVGETVLSGLGGKPFNHNVFSVVVAQEIERKGKGLNLTYETLDGILLHSRGNNELKTDKEKPQEYAAVMYADKIAYTFSDLNDALRYGLLKEEPKLVGMLGDSQRKRVDGCIVALIKESLEKEYVSFSGSLAFRVFDELKAFMYENVYHKMDWSLHKDILHKAYDFFNTQGIDPIVAIALLTDKEANKLGQLFLSSRKLSLEDIHDFGVYEIIPYIKEKKIAYSSPSLEWGA
jgi:dGTPase